MAQDRIQRYSKIRTWLGRPKAQKPSPHDILNQMLTDEQALNLRLTNTGKPWSLVSQNIVTVAGTSTYSITQPVTANQSAGKVHFVVRATDDVNLPYVAIPYDDFNQLDYGKMPTGVNANLAVPEKISFYRTNMQDQTIKAVIQPVPQEVLTYTVWFFTGDLDRLYAAMSSSAAINELSDWLDLNSTMALLPYSEWNEYKRGEETMMRQKTLAAGLMFQLEKLNPTVDTFISSMNAETSFQLGYWND